MEYADQRKEPTRGGEVASGLFFQRVDQLPGRPIVDRAAGHVDRFDLLRGCLAHRLVVGIADREIFAHHPPEPRQAQPDAAAQNPKTPFVNVSTAFN